MAGRTCREAVERVPSTRAVLTDEESKRVSWTEIEPLAVAVMEGDVEALEWLIKRHDAWCPDRPDWCDDADWMFELSWLAAKHGKIEILACLRAIGCPWYELTCMGAAEGGHLGVLQWVRLDGCPWDEWTCTKAARGGHLEVLQWAHENGCPWDEWTWASSDPSCHPYLIEHGCPGADDADDE